MAPKKMSLFDRFTDKFNGFLGKLPPIVAAPIAVCVYVPIVAVGTAVYVGMLCGAILFSPCIVWCFAHTMCEESGIGVPKDETFFQSIKRWLWHDIKWCFSCKKD